MKGLAIYALLNGITHCSKIHGIEEKTIRTWISKLDFENDPFFQCLRKYILTTIQKLGIENTSNILEIPLKVLKLFMTIHGTIPRETKKSIIRLYLLNTTILEISNQLQISKENVENTINLYHQASIKNKNNVMEIIDSSNTSNLKKELDSVIIL